MPVKQTSASTSRSTSGLQRENSSVASAAAKAKAILRRYVGFEWTKNGFHWMNRNVEMVDAEFHAQVCLSGLGPRQADS